MKKTWNAKNNEGGDLLDINLNYQPKYNDENKEQNPLCIDPLNKSFTRGGRRKPRKINIESSSHIVYQII